MDINEMNLTQEQRAEMEAIDRYYKRKIRQTENDFYSAISELKNEWQTKLNELADRIAAPDTEGGDR